MSGTISVRWIGGAHPDTLILTLPILIVCSTAVSVKVTSLCPMKRRIEVSCFIRHSCRRCAWDFAIRPRRLFGHLGYRASPCRLWSGWPGRARAGAGARPRSEPWPYSHGPDGRPRAAGPSQDARVRSPLESLAKVGTRGQVAATHLMATLAIPRIGDPTLVDQGAP